MYFTLLELQASIYPFGTPVVRDPSFLMKFKLKLRTEVQFYNATYWRQWIIVTEMCEKSLCKILYLLLAFS